MRCAPIIIGSMLSFRLPVTHAALQAALPKAHHMPVAARGSSPDAHPTHARRTPDAHLSFTTRPEALGPLIG